MQYVVPSTAVTQTRSEPVPHVDSHILPPHLQLVVEGGDEPVEDDEVPRLERVRIGVAAEGEYVGMGERREELGLHSQVDDALVVLVLGEIRAESFEHVPLRGGLFIVVAAVGRRRGSTATGVITVRRFVERGREGGTRRGLFVPCVVNFLQFDVPDLVDKAEASPSDDLAQNDFLECQCGQRGRRRSAAAVRIIQRGCHYQFVVVLKQCRMETRQVVDDGRRGEFARRRRRGRRRAISFEVEGTAGLGLK
mmetsp:Transcript_28372/g.60095  ORF Transcript_28372/g.60095 Transcript_28372/m.60095 type:complete len:251 (-) Transcript_28372:231-983(-)